MGEGRKPAQKERWHGAVRLRLEGLFLAPWAALTCGAAAALLLQRTGLRGSPWVRVHLLRASPLHPREGGKWREGTSRRASLYGRLGVETTERLWWWETWLGEQPREGRLPAMAWTGRRSRSPGDTCSLEPTSHRTGACAGWGPRATGGTQLRQRCSAKQPAVSLAPALPLLISLCSSPGRLARHSQPWPQQRRAARPLLQRAHQPQERGEPGAAGCSHAPACRSHLALVGRSPAFCSKKPVLEPAAAAPVSPPPVES